LAVTDWRLWFLAFMTATPSIRSLCSDFNAKSVKINDLWTMARDGQGERHKLMTATQKVRTLHFRKKEVKLKESRCGRAAGSQSRPAVMLRARESPQPQKSQQSAPHAQLLRYTR